MAKAAVAYPVNLRISGRQSSSEANHINRIRLANSKRQFDPIFSSIDKVNPLTDLTLNQVLNLRGENISERVSISDFLHRRKSHAKCIPRESLEELYNNKPKLSAENLHHTKVKRRKSATSLKPDATRKQINTSKQNVKPEVCKSSGKTSNVNSHVKENPQKSPKRSAQINKTNQKVKAPVSNRKISSAINNEHIKTDEKHIDSSTQDNRFDFEHGLKQITRKIENITSEKTLSSKDVIVLKWLHGLNCPLSEIKHTTSEVNRNPIQILKKPLNIKMSKSADIFTENVQSSAVKKNSKLSTKEIEKSPVSKGNQKLPDSYPERQKAEARSTEVVAKAAADVEMHVSELGKLQIILNPKSLTPEDAAIIIWIKDIPKTLFTPDYSRRLSLSPKSNFQRTESSTRIIKSHSVPYLEDIATSKPNIYFPPVTVLQNLAVDSSTGLRKLSEDFSNSVYYKRCNLSHAEWGVSETVF